MEIWNEKTSIIVKKRRKMFDKPKEKFRIDFFRLSPANGWAIKYALDIARLRRWRCHTSYLSMLLFILDCYRILNFVIYVWHKRRHLSCIIGVHFWWLHFVVCNHFNYFCITKLELKKIKLIWKPFALSNLKPNRALTLHTREENCIHSVCRYIAQLFWKTCM